MADMENYEGLILTERQQALYEFIVQESFIGHRKLTQKDICDALPQFYQYHERKNSSDKCSTLWNDVNTINQCADVDYIIITKKYEYWIGSAEETKRFKNYYFAREIRPRLKRWWNFVRKIQKNGQGYQVENENGDFDTFFHSMFNDYDVELQKEIDSYEQNETTND